MLPQLHTSSFCTFHWSCLPLFQCVWPHDIIIHCGPCLLVDLVLVFYAANQPKKAGDRTWGPGHDSDHPLSPHPTTTSQSKPWSLGATNRLLRIPGLSSGARWLSTHVYQCASIFLPLLLLRTPCVHSTRCSLSCHQRSADSASECQPHPHCCHYQCLKDTQSVSPRVQARLLPSLSQLLHGHGHSQGEESQGSGAYQEDGFGFMEGDAICTL